MNKLKKNTLRLETFLSFNTILTRSQAREKIKQRKVIVNNNVITNPAFKVTDFDVIFLDNEIINKSKNYYFAFNKPKGFICANKDNLHQTILSFFPDEIKDKLQIVGRLDKDTTGLVFLTSDGEWNHKLKSPKKNIEKEYLVSLEKEMDEEMIKKLNEPIFLDDKKIKEFKFKLNSNKQLFLTITEGKYHQIKRMIKLIGNNVIELKRIRISNVYLSELKLKEGEYIEIDPNI
ncbi:MAG: pseudouridine synthase [Metamycoplasmataceae bacterium]